MTFSQPNPADLPDNIKFVVDARDIDPIAGSQENIDSSLTHSFLVETIDSSQVDSLQDRAQQIEEDFRYQVFSLSRSVDSFKLKDEILTPYREYEESLRGIAVDNYRARSRGMIDTAFQIKNVFTDTDPAGIRDTASSLLDLAFYYETFTLRDISSSSSPEGAKDGFDQLANMNSSFSSWETEGLNIVDDLPKSSYWTYLKGYRGNDLIIGRGDGKGVLMGYEGDDVLKREGVGTTILHGAKGFDQITGGEGPDVIYLTEGYGFDTITNFTEGDGIVTLTRALDGERIAPADLNVVNHSSGDAFILYGDDLLAVVTGAAGMLQIGQWQAPGTYRLDALV